MTTDEKTFREIARRAAIQNARRAEGQSESTIDSSDEEYDAPPASYWAGQR